MFSFLPLQSVTLTDSMWAEVQRLVREAVLPYQWETLNDRVPDAAPSYCIHNLRLAAGDISGEFGGEVFQDSDLYKWLEAVAYSLSLHPDKELESLADGVIDLIGRAQQPDGYLNTYYTVKAPDQRFRNFTEGHELYCAGHLLEAAVAYQEATGKRKLLDIALRLSDCIARNVMDANGRATAYPGHPEIELALIRAYELTGEERLLRLSRALLDARGAKDSLFDRERNDPNHAFIWPLMLKLPRSYFQDHLPVREQTYAAGHSVRAMYLYSAMADVARHDGDSGLSGACGSLFENTVRKQMYITGGIGSAADGERFTTDFDLPNDSVYAESCASIGLMMFAKRMWLLTRDSSCYRVWDKALYNTVLAGMGNDGRHFFYVNPLETTPRVIERNPTLQHVKYTRQKWFGCACCPPNLARTFLSLGNSLYADDGDSFYVLSQIDSRFDHNALRGALSHEGDQYKLTLDAPARKLCLRLPEGYEMRCGIGQSENGYWVIPHAGGMAEYSYTLRPLARVMHADPRIASDAGKVCVMRGQSVYCLEEADNGSELCELALPADAKFSEVAMTWLPKGLCGLQTTGLRYRAFDGADAYREAAPTAEEAVLTFVPYSQWNNRGAGEMKVWVNRA